MSTKKLYASCEAAVADIGDNSTVLVGGFGDCGSPAGLLLALANSDTAGSGLTLVAGTGGSGPDSPLGRLLRDARVRRLVSTYVGADAGVYRRHAAGQLELRLEPQGTFAERLRAGGSGVAAFYTRVGVGTDAQAGGVPIRYDDDDGGGGGGVGGRVLEATPAKETRVLNGEQHVLEFAIRGDCALVKAWRADTVGNLVMRRSANNFNSAMAAAADVTVAEVEELVEAGQLDPDSISVPGVCVQRLVLRPRRRRQRQQQQQQQQRRRRLRDADIRRIVRRVAVELATLPTDAVVNLGLGIPTLVANWLPADQRPTLHSENGVLGVGRALVDTDDDDDDDVNNNDDDDKDDDVINASRDRVTLAPGAVCLDSATSFGLVNSGRLAATVLGATQVSQFGDLANWIVPGRAAVGMGGAMDLVSRPDSTRVIVAMRHSDAAGRPKILGRCTLPLTGCRCVRLLVTDMAVFSVCPVSGLTLTEIADNCSLREVANCTGCRFAVSPQLSVMPQAPEPAASDAKR